MRPGHFKMLAIALPRDLKQFERSLRTLHLSLRSCRHVVARTLQGLCACRALGCCKGRQDLT